MLAKFVFFGSETILPDGTVLSRYGQVVSMEPEAADALIAAAPPALLLPTELWDKIFLSDDATAALLAEFPSTSIHETAPAEFRAQADAVRVAYHEYRVDLLKRIAQAAKDGTLKVTFAEDRKAKPAPESDGAVETKPEG